MDPDKLWAIMVKRKKAPLDIIEEGDFEPRAVGEWLTGIVSPRASNLRRLARILGTTERELMQEQEQAS